MSELKSLTLICAYCGRRRTFQGADVQQLLARVDASGWQQLSLTSGICPDCASLPDAESEASFSTVRSSDFTWRTGSHEVFTFQQAGQPTLQWDVQAAKVLLQRRPRPVYVLDISPLWDWLAPGLIEVDAARVALADLSVPLILAKHADPGLGGCLAELVIDGWHRIARAKLEGERDLLAVLLTAEESTAICREVTDNRTAVFHLSLETIR